MLGCLASWCWLLGRRESIPLPQRTLQKTAWELSGYGWFRAGKTIEDGKVETPIISQSSTCFTGHLHSMQDGETRGMNTKRWASLGPSLKLVTITFCLCFITTKTLWMPPNKQRNTYISTGNMLSDLGHSYYSTLS